MYVRQAVVLVGGKGTRLGDLTRDIPKPLLEIAPGIRFLDTLLFELARHRFTDILLLAGHLGEQVKAAYHDTMVLTSRIRVLCEPEPKGTGGALRFAANELSPWFLLTNGDSLFEFNFRDLAKKPSEKFIGQLALRTVPDPTRYGSVDLDGSRVVGFKEKDPTLSGPALINGGVYVFSKDVLSWIRGPCSLEAEVLPALARAGSLSGRIYDGYFLDIGLTDTYAQAKVDLPDRHTRPCAFLDRDGVLNIDSGYTHRVDQLQWIEGAPEAIRMLNEAGYYVVVVSNQAGVARGLYDEAQIALFHNHMDEQLGDIGAHIDAWYYCPFHPEAIVDSYRHANHPDRKPNPGMLLRVMREFSVDLARSFLVGDTDSDIVAARNAGVPTSYLFKGGNLRQTVEVALASNIQKQS